MKEPARFGYGRSCHNKRQFLVGVVLLKANESTADSRSLKTRSVEIGGEWLLIALWTLSVARGYLNLDPLMNPIGREYFTAVQNHFLWERLKECGQCAFWNGNSRGGYPAFADMHNAALHPVVVVASLTFCALSGAKIGLIAILFTAGIAQWWLARELGLGTIARLWSAGMAVSAGNLAGRMENGMFPLVVAGASVTLTLPALLRLHRDGTHRSAALLGLALGVLLLAGQAYLQIGFAILAPFIVLLVAQSTVPVAHLVRRYVHSLGISLLVAAPFLIPLARFHSSFTKWMDPTFAPAQPFRYVALNLLFPNDLTIKSRSYGMQPYPFLYFNYIGWVAVVCAIIGAVVLFRNRLKLGVFFVGWVIGAMWIASATPLKWLRDRTVDQQAIWEFIVGIRNPPVIAGIAVPAILALAAVGVDRLWERSVSHIHLGGESEPRDRLGTWSLRLVSAGLLIYLLQWSLADTRQAARGWLRLTPQVADVGQVLDALTPPSAEWINPPFGEEFWIGEALTRNLKLSHTVTIWSWAGRTDPQPVLEAGRFEPLDGMTLRTTIDGISIYEAPPGFEYAAVVHADGSRTPCVAQSHGGNVDVICDTLLPGQLQVEENWYSGWKANVDGQAQAVSAAGRWLGVDVPAGRTTIELRYRPWDAPLGLLLSAVGFAIAIWLIGWGDRHRARPFRRMRIPQSPQESRTAGSAPNS